MLKEVEKLSSDFVSNVDNSVILDNKILGDYFGYLVTSEKRRFFDFTIATKEGDITVPTIELESIKFQGEKGVIDMIIGVSPIHAFKFFKYIKRNPVAFEDIASVIENNCRYESIDNKVLSISHGESGIN